MLIYNKAYLKLTECYNKPLLTLDLIHLNFCLVEFMIPGQLEIGERFLFL